MKIKLRNPIEGFSKVRYFTHEDNKYRLYYNKYDMIEMHRYVKNIKRYVPNFNSLILPKAKKLMQRHPV